MSTMTEEFWSHFEEATDRASYKPLRNEKVVVSRLETAVSPYYVIKEPNSKNYLRLSEEDYALWWQMNGDRRVKDLIFYSLKRYKTLPFAHLNSLIQELRNGNFLQDKPVNLYDQVEAELEERAPSSRGQKILEGFLHSEFAFNNLDPFFTKLYRYCAPLFSNVGQVILLAIILLGGTLFAWLFLNKTYSLAGGGVIGVVTLILANTIIIGIHELAHGLATKHVGRELDRGGVLLYWGMPAFFVDTRDIWLSSRKERILVTWAGPHSGLMIGAITGILLTAVANNFPEVTGSIIASFVYQMGFLAFLSVFFNLNPLLELDGYFILMDWLEMPGLRQRSFQFIREGIPAKLHETKNPKKLWQGLRKTERIFTFFGILALVYSVAALWFALSFWRSRLVPFFVNMWEASNWGKLGVLIITAVMIVPSVYFILEFSWSRIQQGLEWLARRDLLARPDVLALLIGLPVMLGVPLILYGLGLLPQGLILSELFLYTVYLTVIAIIAGIAKQLRGSRFQWAIWSLTAVPVGLLIAYQFRATPFLHDLGLMAAAGAILACGIVAWFTVNPSKLERSDLTLMAFFVIIALLLFSADVFWLDNGAFLENGRWLAAAFTIFCTCLGLTMMAPLILNFRHSRFALAWLLIVISILAIPVLQRFPQLSTPIISLWLFAMSLYLVLGTLAQFFRTDVTLAEIAAFSERDRLIHGFNGFLQALFVSYEAVFGGRRLHKIQAELVRVGPLDPQATILDIADRARKALLLTVDRLDDLAGTPFTRRAGQAAYDSLPYLEAEALARYVLANMVWGSQLAKGFIQARDRRALLIRQADIFAGFDQDGVAELSAVMQDRHYRAGQQIARAERDAQQFFLVEYGEIGVYHDGLQMATLNAGGYFGINALMDSGNYNFSYRALRDSHLLMVERKDFDPLLRADTTLAQQVNSGAQERGLLRKMALFSSLSPQEIAMIDARLETKRVKGGEQFVQEGQARSHLFIIAEGMVEVFTTTEDGHEKINGRLGVGEHFGEYALFADTPYLASCRAITDTRLLLLDEPTFDRLVADCDRMSHYVEQIGSGRLMVSKREANASAILS